MYCIHFYYDPLFAFILKSKTCINIAAFLFQMKDFE